MNYSIGQLQTLLRQGGFPEGVIVVMSAIGMAESGGRSDAVNDGSGTRSVEYSVGLWQVNTHAHKNYTVSQLKNPEINVREALRIYKLQGFRAWGAFTDGRYKKYLAAAKAAAVGTSAALPELVESNLPANNGNSAAVPISATTILIGGLVLILALK